MAAETVLTTETKQAATDPLPSAICDIPTCLLKHLGINRDADFVKERTDRLDFCWQAIIGAMPQPTHRDQLFLFPSMIPHMADMFCMSVIQEPRRPVTHGAATFGMALLAYYFTSDAPDDRLQFTAINELQRRVLETACIIAPAAADRCKPTKLPIKTDDTPKTVDNITKTVDDSKTVDPSKTDDSSKTDVPKPSSSKTEPSESGKYAARAYTQGYSRDWHTVASGILYYLLIGVKIVQTTENKPRPAHRHPIVVETGFLSYLLLTTQLHPIRIQYAHLTPTELLLLALDADGHNDFLRRNRRNSGVKTTGRKSFQYRYSVSHPNGKRPSVLFGLAAAGIPTVIVEIRRVLARLVGRPERQMIVLTAFAEIGIAVADAMIDASKQSGTGTTDNADRMLQIGYVLTEFVQVAAMVIKGLTSADFRDQAVGLACDKAYDTDTTT